MHAAIPYASWTGTKRNLREMQAHQWRLLMSPETLKRSGWRAPLWPDGAPAPYALDNGAWTAFQQKHPFDEVVFLRALDAVGMGADWICVPDIVADPHSFAFSLSWLPRMSGYPGLLLPVQDGMTPEQVRPLIGQQLGIAVGGSTEWKLKTLAMWAAFARSCGAYCHILRVNSERRIKHCIGAGAQSFDGTSGTRFAVNIPRLDRAARWKQQGLFT